MLVGAGISPRNVGPDWNGSPGVATAYSPAREAPSATCGSASNEGVSAAVTGPAESAGPASAESRAAATAALVKRAVLGMVSPCRRSALRVERRGPPRGGHPSGGAAFLFHAWHAPCRDRGARNARREAHVTLVQTPRAAK